MVNIMLREVIHVSMIIQINHQVIRNAWLDNKKQETQGPHRSWATIIKQPTKELDRPQSIKYKIPRQHRRVYLAFQIFLNIFKV